MQLICWWRFIHEYIIKRKSYIYVKVIFFLHLDILFLLHGFKRHKKQWWLRSYVSIWSPCTSLVHVPGIKCLAVAECHLDKRSIQAICRCGGFTLLVTKRAITPEYSTDSGTLYIRESEIVVAMRMDTWKSNRNVGFQTVPELSFIP